MCSCVITLVFLATIGAGVRAHDPEDDHRLEAIFAKFDADKDGFLSVDELNGWKTAVGKDTLGKKGFADLCTSLGVHKGVGLRIEDLAKAVGEGMLEPSHDYNLIFPWSEEHQMMLTTIFNKFDVDYDAHVSLDEMNHWQAAVGEEKLDEATFQEICTLLSSQSSKGLSKESMQKGCREGMRDIVHDFDLIFPPKQEKYQEVKELFLKFDADKNSCLSRHEMNNWQVATNNTPLDSISFAQVIKTFGGKRTDKCLTLKMMLEATRSGMEEADHDYNMVFKTTKDKKITKGSGKAGISKLFDTHVALIKPLSIFGASLVLVVMGLTLMVCAAASRRQAQCRDFCAVSRHERLSSDAGEVQAIDVEEAPMVVRLY
jgi:Ca2+-binding EF-hand superfamily protein